LLLQAQQETPLMQDTIENLSCALLVSFTQMFVCDRNDSHSSHQKLSTTLVHRAKLYIRDNLSQPLRLKDVASYLHLSSRHLSRLFAEELGQTFSDYVRQERIRQAAHLLSSTDHSIKSIAEETGFATVHYFTSVFKELLGVTPGEFHKKLARNE
jgi:YesN/AraC family two-component response regulator